MAEEHVQRRLAAILAADVVGYSRLIEKDEAGTLAALKAHMGELILPAIAEHHGRLVKTIGDGCIAEFGSVVDAVRCAIAIQRGATRRNVNVIATKRLEYRVGVNLGDVVVEGDDLYGDGINIAARLQQQARPGGVLVSGAAYDQLQGKIDAALEFVGEQRVKNIARPLRSYQVQLDGKLPKWRPRFRRMDGRVRWVVAVSSVLLLLAVGAWHFWPRNAAPRLVSRASLAVLPFTNIAGDEATGRLADGLTEDVITDLSRYRDLDVIAHNSTKVYKNRAVDLREVGRELNVRYVLKGSVQREADQIRITAQLIDANNDTHLWSERWDRPAKEFFAVQSDIADQLGNRLGGVGVIDVAEQETVRRARPDDLTAYELYLAGRSEEMRLTSEGYQSAIKLLERAVAADPGLARAWTELSGVHQGLINFGEDPAVVLPTAVTAARRAIEIDPGDAMAHATLGRALGLQGNSALSEAEFDTALRLNPGDAEILAQYSSWATTFGHPERAADAADHAIRLDPNYNFWQAYDFSYAYFSAGRHEDTLRILDRLPKDKYIFYSWVLRAASYAALGQPEKARLAAADALAHYPDLTIEGFTGTPDWSDAERKHLVETMRAAGFPACAKPDMLARSTKLVRLPECLSK
jgi:TolB-like protein/class 3 adenylate cyclase